MINKSENQNQKAETGTIENGRGAESDVRPEGVLPESKTGENERAASFAEDKVRDEGGIEESRSLIEALGIEGAEPWPEAVEGKELLDELKATLERFVVLPKWAGDALALWVVHTYAYQFRDVSTYVAVESPQKRCGKTTLLSVLSELVNRPIVAANISSPAFFRVIEETQPTLLIDEADTFLAGNDELRGILNAGYRRKTAYVVRVAPRQVQGPKSKVQSRAGSRLARFSCWCPKVIAAIGRLPETLADRCIVIRMQRKTADERCDRLRFLDASMMRRKCARFVRDYADTIKNALPDLPQGLNDRAADIWEPLIAVADLAGGDWPQRAREAASGLSATRQDNGPMACLLAAIARAFAQSGGCEIFSQALVAALNASGEGQWAELNKGKPATELWLAGQLRGLGIRPQIRRIGDKRARGYALSDFEEAFREHVPALAAERRTSQAGS